MTKTVSAPKNRNFRVSQVCCYTSWWYPNTCRCVTISKVYKTHALHVWNTFRANHTSTFLPFLSCGRGERTTAMDHCPLVIMPCYYSRRLLNSLMVWFYTIKKCRTYCGNKKMIRRGQDWIKKLDLKCEILWWWMVFLHLVRWQL